MNAPSKLVQRINPLHLVPIYNQSFTMAALKNKASTLQQVSADLAERAGGLMRLDAQWSWGGGTDEGRDAGIMYFGDPKMMS